MIPVSSVSEKACHSVGQGTDITNTEIACLCDLKHYSKTVKKYLEIVEVSTASGRMHRTQPVHLRTAACSEPASPPQCEPRTGSPFVLLLLFLALKTKLKLVNLISPFLL